MEEELYELKSNSQEVNFEYDRIKNIDVVAYESSCMRVIKDGRLGFAETTKKGDIEFLRTASIRTSRLLPEVNYSFAKNSSFTLPEIYYPDDPRFSFERELNICKNAINKIKASFPEVYCFAQMGKSTSNIKLTTNLGFDEKYKKTEYYFVIGGNFSEEGNFIQVFAGKANCSGDIEFERFTDYVLRLLTYAKRNVKIEKGKYPIIFSPYAVSDLMLPFMQSLNGRVVEKGISPFRNKIGEKLFDGRFTLIDDGLIKDGLNSVPFDDEGIPSTTLPLIEEGVLRGFYLDLKSASSLGLKPTGNGFKAKKAGQLQPQVSPSPRNWAIKNGEKSIEDIIKDIKEGLLIENLMGTFAGNLYSGEVSGNVAMGFKIENGEIVGRVKNTMISLNVFKALKDSLMEISKETEVTFGTFYPYIVLSDVNVSVKV
jgi:PmbA protein